MLKLWDGVVTQETRNAEREEHFKEVTVQKQVSHGGGGRVFYKRDWKEVFRDIGGKLR